MKKSVLFLLLLGSAFQILAQNALTVNINNIKGDKGAIRVALFNQEDQFLKTAFKGQEVTVSGSSVSLTFENLPAGKYAISVMHDENANDELDSNFIGIPKEGFGFSNNAKSTFGPPKFEEASFEVPVTQPVSIALKYM